MTVIVPIVLASTSAIRAEMLRAAGVLFDIEAPRVDENEVKKRFSAVGANAEAIAAALADAKAEEVSRRRSGLVIGCDQILRADGALYDKARTMSEARQRLLSLRGREHELVGAASLACDGAVIARHEEVSRLKMRDFSEAFLDAYLDEAGERILASVGCYQLEGLGAQLFERVEGDYFAVLGLPLLPVLNLLRAEGALAA